MGSSPARPGYIASQDELLARLRRIRGQVGGLEGMIEQQRYCIDILTQISAVQAALDKVAVGVLAAPTRNCVVDAPADERQQKAGEMVDAVTRLLRRR